MQRQKLSTRNHFIIKLFLFFLVVTPGYAANTLQGIWKTQGYGYLLHIDRSNVDIYEVSDISCLKSGLQPGEISYQQNKLSFDVSIPGFIQAIMHVTQGENDNVASFHRDDTISYVQAERLDALPEICTSSSSPTTVEVFKQAFKEHYPFFEQHRRPFTKIEQPVHSTEELFKLLTSHLKPLGDSHVALVAPDLGKMYFGHEDLAGASRDVMATNALLAKLTNSTHFSFANQQLTFAKLTKNVSYLNVNSFAGYSKSGAFKDESEALNQAMNNVLKDKAITHLILDLRNNHGGSDKLALKLAGYFTEASYPAYNKQAFLGLHGNWTNAHVNQVHPSPSVVYSGRLTLLTDTNTMSAGETFVMAMMNRKPEVTRIGKTTRGSFSDMLPRTLPNGWLFALPNERYLDSSGQSYDWRGIPPHSEVDSEQLVYTLKQLIKLETGEGTDK